MVRREMVRVYPWLASATGSADMVIEVMLPGPTIVCLPRRESQLSPRCNGTWTAAAKPCLMRSPSVDDDGSRRHVPGRARCGRMASAVGARVALNLLNSEI